MQFTEEDVVLFQERMLAIQEILSDLSEMFNNKTEEVKEVEEEPVKEVKKETKKEKPAEEVKQPEDNLEDVIAEYELNDMSEDDLKEYLTDYEVKFPAKAKKTKLIELVAKAIMDGTIPVESDEVEEVEELAADEEEPEEISKREDEEQKILNSIEEQVIDKKLTKKKAQEWLKELYANHDTCKNCPKNCNEDPIECYKNVQISFVDDEGEVHDTCEGYIRDGVAFCCGVECEDFEEGKVVCTVCGEVYDMEEDE